MEFFLFHSWGLRMDWVIDPQHEQIDDNFHLLQHFNFFPRFSLIPCYRFRFWRLKSIFMQFTTKRNFSWPCYCSSQYTPQCKLREYCKWLWHDEPTKGISMENHKNALQTHFAVISPFHSVTDKIVICSDFEHATTSIDISMVRSGWITTESNDCKYDFFSYFLAYFIKCFKEKFFFIISSIIWTILYIDFENIELIEQMV